MVEVLISGILLASVLTAVSRISVAALSSSAGLSDRARIEAAINDNIQAMQKEDSYYTDEWIVEEGGEDALQRSCSDPNPDDPNDPRIGPPGSGPPIALRDHLQTIAPEPRLTAITRTFDIDTVPGILRIVYSFEGPEQQIEAEQRIIEMTPNFGAKCYSTQ